MGDVNSTLEFFLFLFFHCFDTGREKKWTYVLKAHDQNRLTKILFTLSKEGTDQQYVAKFEVLSYIPNYSLLKISFLYYARTLPVTPDESLTPLDPAIREGNKRFIWFHLKQKKKKKPIRPHNSCPFPTMMQVLAS